LRAFHPNGERTPVISCSIDPTKEGLQRLTQAVAYARENAAPNDTRQIVDYFRSALGMQAITIKGVSPKTHFAQVLVDADYHMKLIGIGLENPPVPITSFIAKAKPNSVANNSLQRWYFQPKYDYVRIAPDEMAMQLEGGGVQLVSEDERVSARGDRTRTGSSNRASLSFCRSFTDLYSELAERMPLYAELRNLVDMSVAAAFIQEVDFYGQAGWKLGVFADESVFQVEKYEVPSQIAPAINAVWKGNVFMTPIGGGVNIQPRVALSPERMTVDESGSIEKTKNSIELGHLSEGQWWWD
jgi:hypothetical protein